jgi:O-antigen biosynthesis protein WbqV
VLELEELVAGSRVLITGGGGSIAQALTTLLLGFRPERITLLDAHEGALIADRRSRDAAALERVEHALGDVRERSLLERRFEAAAPNLVFHLAAYKHVDLGESFPEQFVDTNLHGTWSVLESAAAVGAERVVVASTDKAALAASFYGRTKRLIEQLTASAARRGVHSTAVRFVNVLGSAGSASELFLRQSRAGVPLTVTDTGMMRYWITMAHATTLAVHGALLAGRGVPLAGPAELPMLTVGELAERIWRAAGPGGELAIEEIGIRDGETLSEVLTGPGEELGPEAEQGIAPIEGEVSTAAAEWVAERLPAAGDRDAARAVWLEAMGQPGLIGPAES